MLTDMDMDLMIKQHIKQKPLATLAVTTRKTSRYFLFDELEIYVDGKMRKQVNKK